MLRGSSCNDTHDKLSLSILGKPYKTNEVPHNESETEMPKNVKNFSKRSASCIENAKSSVNAKLKKRKRSIRFVLKSRKPILSSTQKPAECLDREKENHEQLYRFLHPASASSARWAICFSESASPIESADSIYVWLQRTSRIATFLGNRQWIGV